MVTPARVLVSAHAIVPRVERQHALIELLRIRAPRASSGSWIARELGVSTRTVERDIAELVEAGLPIRVERGPGGGYAIDARRELPAIAFTPGEASALIAALVAIGRPPRPPRCPRSTSSSARSRTSAELRHKTDTGVSGLPSTVAA